MIKLADILERIREVISCEKDGKILYKDIASALEIGQDYLAVIKRRGKIPYEALALFADKKDINLNWILMGKKPKHIKRQVG